MYPVILYTDKNGVCELADFFDELDNSHQKSDQALFKKIYRQIGMLQEQGPLLREPYAKLIKGNSYHIMELRPQPERIFYVAGQGKQYILLHHYTKKQNKTSQREIKKATAKMIDWLKREG